MRLDVDPGTEKYVPWARRLLGHLTGLRLDLGLPAMTKVYAPESGTLVYVHSAEAADFVRITGGNTWAWGDPIAPSWTADADFGGTPQGEQRAMVLPASRPGSSGGEEWAPIDTSVKEVVATYLERTRAVVRTVAGVDYTLMVQEQTTTHTLMLCRYCQRVAQYTWDEVWTFDPGYAPTPDAVGYSVTGSLVSYDITNVFRTDLLSDGTSVNPTTTAHGLAAAALVNPWGWCGENGVPAAPAPPITQAYIDQCVSILNGVVALLTQRVTADAAEMLPLADAPYQDQGDVYVFPVQNVAQILVGAGGGVGTGSATVTLAAPVSIMNMLFTNIAPWSGFPDHQMFGASLKLLSTPPTPPYSGAVLPPVKYVFDPGTKTFSLVPVPLGAPSWFVMKKAYFSSGTDLTALLTTSIGELTRGALYKIASSATSKGAFNGTLGRGDDPTTVPPGVNPAVRMRAMCVGLPSSFDLSYACYSALFTKRGAHYRQLGHTYTSGGYTATQAAIPNTDYP